MIPGINAVKKKPTLKHRPAIWENMLATVFAMNDEGKVKYFDYDYDGAIEFSGIKTKTDVRCFKAPRTYECGEYTVRKGRVAVWVETIS